MSKKISHFFVHSTEMERINVGLECRNLSVDDVISITFDPKSETYTVWFKEEVV